MIYACSADECAWEYLRPDLKKRTHVYVCRPKDYEISGCECGNDDGNDDPDWSEYEGHCWCPFCKIDFIPQHAGVFDGPVPMNTMRLIGIPVDKYSIATGEIE